MNRCPRQCVHLGVEDVCLEQKGVRGVLILKAEGSHTNSNLETRTKDLTVCGNLSSTVQEIWDSDNIHYKVDSRDMHESGSYPV